MLHSQRRPASGFTLIELLTVIAIIGILAAIIIPTVGKVRETAQRSVDASNLHQIAVSAAAYAADNKDVLPNPNQTNRAISQGTKYYQWFGQLAKYGGLNDASLLVSKNDGAVDAASAPLTVLDPSDTTRSRLATDFVNLATLSFDVVGGLKMSDPSTTPIAFTRGLKSTGTWNGTGSSDNDVNLGVYKDTGGHVVFLGGNVQFYNSISDSLTANTGKPTSNIRQAVPNRTGSSGVFIFGKDTANAVASESGAAPVAGP